MARVMQFLFGRGRAVPVLGATEIIAWGTLIYPPVLIVPIIAVERGWSLAFGMSGFSLALFTGGLVSPFVGRMIDERGGHVVMTAGLLLAAAVFMALIVAVHPIAYLAAWAMLGVAMAASLYDAAFASLTRVFGAMARRPLTAITLAGGFASTVSWPLTRLLVDLGGWRMALAGFACLTAAVAAPLVFLALPRTRASDDPVEREIGGAIKSVLPPRGRPFVFVAAAFASYAFVPSALAAHMLAIFQRHDIAPATAVVIGMIFGPAQVMARVCELTIGRRLAPIAIALGALGLLLAALAMLGLFGVTVPTAALFALAFGTGNGLMTLARGNVPLSLFGPGGYGRMIGRIAGPSLVIQSAAPFTLAFVIDRSSDAVALALIGLFALFALVSLLSVNRTRR